MRVKSLDYNVKAVYDGLDAIASIVSDKPDLLILDVDMPGADGLSVCEKVAEYQQFDPLPVILLTGRNDVKAIETAYRAGAYYVCKNDKTWETLEPLIQNLMSLAADVTAFRAYAANE